MGDLKPLGSEKLKSDEKLKRILELTYYKNNNSKSEKKAELVKESKSGGIYGIVKEKDGYYVKRGLNENTLDYIGGIFMKNKNRFNSYAEALKRLELIKGQEELNEATKYVLKQNKTQQEAPPSEPTMDVPPPPPPTDDAGAPPPPPSPEGEEVPPPPSGEDEMPPAPEGEPSSDETKPEGEGSGKRSDYMAEVQKYAGKLGQELRDLHDRMESDDIKYVLNMVISAVDLDKLEEEDIEEIAKKFEREEEEMGDDDMAPSPEEGPEAEEEPTPEEPSGEEELGEDGDPMSALERFVNTSAVSASDDTPMVSASEIDLSKYALAEDDDIVELDLDEIQSQISQAVAETLKKHIK